MKCELDRLNKQKGIGLMCIQKVFSSKIDEGIDFKTKATHDLVMYCNALYNQSRYTLYAQNFQILTWKILVWCDRRLYHGFIGRQVPNNLGVTNVNWTAMDAGAGSGHRWSMDK